jgi:ribulose-5-phosphate 4-epimerase/fuculose-1-phosphate aldolase
VVLDLDEGRRIAAALCGHKAMILGNHGLLTVGASVEEAAWWFISMDRCCHVQLLAEAAGTLKPIPAESARRARDLIGTPGIARLNFKPLYQSILADMPDLAD